MDAALSPQYRLARLRLAIAIALIYKRAYERHMQEMLRRFL